MNKIIIPKVIFFLFIILLCYQISYGQYNISFENAGILGKKNQEIAIHYSGYDINYANKTGNLFNDFGIRVGFGISKYMDFKFNYSRLSIGDGHGTDYMEFSPKFSIFKNNAALFIPIIVSYDAAGTHAYLNLKFLYTIKVSHQVEINFATKADLPIHNNSDLFYWFNLGLGISDNLFSWAVRPEFGLTLNPKEKASVYTFGLSFSKSVLTE